MKFVQLKAGCFGCLENWESPPLNPGLVVFLGNNEAGKSTLFNLMITVLYGWNPVSGNRFLPWSGAQASCQAVLCDSTGQEFTVHRRLRSRPEGTVIAGGTTVSLGNAALPSLAFLPSQIFSEIYALTIEQLRLPKAGTWQRLQDQLLGGQFTSFLRSSFEVAAELEREANSLWRHDRKGKPKASLLNQSIKILTERKREAEENEDRLRQLEADLEKARGQLAELLQEKTRLKTYLHRAERLYPAVKKLNRINELYKQASDIAAYDHLPSDPGQWLKTREQEARDLKRELVALTGQRAEPSEQQRIFFTADGRSFTQRKKNGDVAAGSNASPSELETLKLLEKEIEVWQNRLADRARDFLQGGWDPGLDTVLPEIDEAVLRTGLDSFKQADLRLQDQAARVEGLEMHAGRKKAARIIPVISLLGIGLGTAAGVWGWGSSLGLAGVLLAIAGCGMGLAWLFLKEGGNNRAELENARRKLAEIEKERGRALTTIKNALNGLPVVASRLETPGESLLLDVIRLKDTFATLQDKLAEADNLRRNIERKVDDLNGKLGKLEEETERFIAALQDMEGSNLEEKINCLIRRRNCRWEAQALEKELNLEYADLAMIKTEVAQAKEDGVEWVPDDEKIARAKTELEQIEVKLNRLNGDIGRMEANLTQMQSQSRLDDIEGEIGRLKAERHAMERKRDRLVLTRNLIMEADRRFREEHQPDVLQRAGKYLRTITGGRYEKLFLKDDEEAGLLVKSNYDDYPLEVERSLSRGTMEQIYLALRLALVDHLDAGNERLPLFFDEVLVNWDAKRLENGLHLLNEISRNRQVFLFTCHHWLAEQVRNSLDGQVVEMVS